MHSAPLLGMSEYVHGFLQSRTQRHTRRVAEERSHLRDVRAALANIAGSSWRIARRYWGPKDVAELAHELVERHRHAGAHIDDVANSRRQRGGEQVDRKIACPKAVPFERQRPGGLPPRL